MRGRCPSPKRSGPLSGKQHRVNLAATSRVHRTGFGGASAPPNGLSVSKPKRLDEARQPGGAERRVRALSAPQRGPGPPFTTCVRRPHFHPLRRCAARIRPLDDSVSARRTRTTHRIAGRGGLCCARRRTLRGVLDASALACRGQASLRLGAQGGMHWMRAGVMGGKGPRGRAGVEAGNDRLAGRVGQALPAHGGHAGQPGRLRCLFAQRLRRERRRGAGAGIAWLGVSIALRRAVSATTKQRGTPRLLSGAT